jgi:hypothetical protein
MSNYDGVIGIDQAALNDFVSAVYAATHDTLLTGTVAVDQPALGVRSIGYDIASAPVVALSPSALVAAFRRNLLAQMDAAGDEARVAALSRASFDLSAGNLVVTVNYAGDTPPAPTVLHASLTAGLEVVADATGNLDPRLVTLVIDLPDDPDLAEIVNKGLVPHLSELIEQTFLKPIVIPPLGLGTVQLAAPVIETGQGRLLATTAILPDVPELAPLAGAWPAGVAFAGVDTKLLNQAIDAGLAGQVFQGAWQRTFKFLFVSVTLIAHYRATVSDANFELVPGQDGRLRGTAVVHADLNFQVHNLASFTATGQATPTVRATAAVTGGNQITVRLDGVDNISFSFDFKNVPSLFDKVLSDIANGLGGTIASAITSGLGSVPPQPVIAIPAVPITAGSETITVSLDQPRVTTLSTPDGKSLLAVTGGSHVTVSHAVHTFVGAEPARA